MHGDGEEDLLDGPFAAGHAELDGCVCHLLEDLERVPVRATVFVDGHVRKRLAGVLDRGLLALAFDELEVAGGALERSEPTRATAPPLRCAGGGEPAATAAEAPTRLPSTNVRNQPCRFSPSMSRSYDPRHACLHPRRSHVGRPRPACRPALRRGRHGRGDPDRPRWTGGQRRRVGGRARRAGALRSGSAETTRPDVSRVRGLEAARCRGRRSRGGPKRGHLLARLARRQPLDGSRSRRSGRVSPGGDRPGVARGLRPPLRLRLRAALRAGPQRRRRSPSSSAGRRARPSASTSRPGARSASAGVDGVPRGCWTSSRRTSSSRTSPRRRYSATRLADALWILKRGARGCAFGDDERPALPVERVVDTTGAGDALAAGWIVGGPDLALEAAARCVQTLGAMP